MKSDKGNPFEEGRAAALAGKGYKACPYDQHSRPFVRWSCGYQSGVIEKRRAQEPPQPPQQMVLIREAQHGR